MTDSSTTVSAAPFVAIAAPFINSIVTALVGIAATWFAVQYHRWTGHAMAQADQDKLRQAAQDEAAVIFAGAEAGISATSINVGDPRIVSAANKVAATIPGVLAITGVTSDGVAHMITAELGKMQAQSTVTPTPVVKAA